MLRRSLLIIPPLMLAAGASMAAAEADPPTTTADEEHRPPVIATEAASPTPPLWEHLEALMQSWWAPAGMPATPVADPNADRPSAPADTEAEGGSADDRQEDQG